MLIWLDGWLSMLRYGRGVELRWKGPAAPVWAVLNRYGVKTYAPGMPGKGVRTVRVPAAQGQWAEYLCLRAGVPLLEVQYAQNCNAVPGKMPKEWRRPARSVGFAGAVFKLFIGGGK